MKYNKPSFRLAKRQNIHRLLTQPLVKDSSIEEVIIEIYNSPITGNNSISDRTPNESSNLSILHLLEKTSRANNPLNNQSHPQQISDKDTSEQELNSAQLSLPASLTLRNERVIKKNDEHRRGKEKLVGLRNTSAVQPRTRATQTWSSFQDWSTRLIA